MELTCNGAQLFYLQKGEGPQTYLFIHNTGGDHRLFLPQLDFFSEWGCAITLDLRGHGASDKPKQTYSIELFGEDLICLCQELGLQSVIAIGASTGGNIALDLACRYPDLVKGAVMIDCGVFLNAQIRKKIGEYRTEMLREDRESVLEQILDDSCLATDRCKEVMRNAYHAVPAYVWEGAFASLLQWDRGNRKRLPACKAPLLYIEACSPAGDRSQLANFKEFFKAYPALMTGKVVGSGHYPSLEVPDQVNAMILQFLKLKGLLP